MTIASAVAAAPPRAPSRVATGTAELDYRPSYLAAALAGLVVFIVYILTLAPTTGNVRAVSIT